MRLAAAVLLLLVPFAAFGQTCPVGPPDPVADNAVRLNWSAVTTNTNGTPIVGTVTYTVYKRVGTTDTVVCTTTATNAGQSNLAVGTHSYVVSARVGTGPESAKAGPVSKAVAAPIPNEPPNLTIASTRIGPDSFTCRDAAGNVLTRHERQDKAQESCTNLAIANLGKPYDVIPSGYRIEARQR